MKKRLLSGLTLSFLGLLVAGCTPKAPTPSPKPEEKTLTSISISQEATQKEFDLNSEFNHDGLKVSASFITGSVESSEDVTSSATISTPDMTSAGEKDVNISYTYNQVTKSTSYKITVKDAASKKATLTMLAAAPNNYINYSGVEENKEYDVGSELTITLDLVRPLSGSATADHYHLFVNENELPLAQVGTEQKLQATYTVEDRDFTIYGFYNDMAEDQSGYTLTLDNPSSDLAVFGFDASKKYTKMYGFVVLKDGYTMSGIKWKYDGESEYRNGVLNNNYQPTNVTQVVNHPEFYTFKIRETSNQAVTNNVHVLFEIIEATKYTITYTYDHEELIDKANSVLPVESVASKKNYLTVVPLSNNTKFAVSSSDVSLEETYNYGQYGFVMPTSNITIHISLIEATISVDWYLPDGVSAFIKRSSDYYSPTITKLIQGETYHLLVTTTVDVVELAYIDSEEKALLPTTNVDDDGNVIYETTFTVGSVTELFIQVVTSQNYSTASLDSTYEENATIINPKCLVGGNCYVRAQFDEDMKIVFLDSNSQEVSPEYDVTITVSEGHYQYSYVIEMPDYDFTITFRSMTI